MDPIQEALKRSIAKRSERLQALLQAVAGEPRFRQLKSELEVRIAEETARLQGTLRKELASADSVRQIQDQLPRLVEEAIASISFHDRVAEIVRDWIASHEKKQPHPTPRELAGLIVQTVREVFADSVRLSPDDITRLAKAQAESSFAKFVASELWTQEVGRIAAVEAERVFQESSKRMQEEVSKVRWAQSKPAARPEDKTIEETVRRMVAEAFSSPQAGEALEGKLRELAQAPAFHQRLKEAARAAAEQALAADPRLNPEALAAQVGKGVSSSVETLRQEIAAEFQKERAAREAAAEEAAKGIGAVREEAKRAAEAAAKPQITAREVKTIASTEARQAAGISEEQARVLAAEEAAKAVAALPPASRPLDADAVRQIALAEIERSRPAAQPPLAGEALAAAIQSDPVRSQLQPWIAQAVGETVRAHLEGLLKRVEERVAKATDWQKLEGMLLRRVEEKMEERLAKSPARGSEEERLIQESARKIVKEEVRPIKEALLQALPAEIQSVVSDLVERQSAELGAQLLGSPEFLETVRRAAFEEVARAGMSSAGHPDDPDNPESEFEKGGIRQQFLALREKNRWKRRDLRRKS